MSYAQQPWGGTRDETLRASAWEAITTFEIKKTNSGHLLQRRL